MQEDCYLQLEFALLVIIIIELSVGHVFFSMSDH